jgi:16S rRNA (uracil1498-N3)-methyltransferase
MRISLIHVDQELSTDATLDLPAETAHYLGTVLRLKPSSPLRVFNGRSPEFQALLISCSRKSAVLEVGPVLRDYSPPALHVHLGQGLIKADRFDWAIQKCTELGVAEITPLITEHSEFRLKGAERLQKKMSHWRRIAVNACEQSGNLHLPTLHQPELLPDWIRSSTETVGIALAPGAKALATVEPAPAYRLLVGPEGGLSDEELDAAVAEGWSAHGLGPRVLRGETAPVAALAVLQSLYGDLAAD